MFEHGAEQIVRGAVDAAGEIRSGLLGEWSAERLGCLANDADACGASGRCELQR